MKGSAYGLSPIAVTIYLLIPEAQAEEVYKSKDQHASLIFDFKNERQVGDWRIVDDGVLGGLSNSEIVYSDGNTAIFRGIVSLANNGGFASTRMIPHSYELNGHDGILLKNGQRISQSTQSDQASLVLYRRET